MEHLKITHSIIRWLVLLFSLYAIVRAYIGMQKKSPFDSADNKAGLFYTSVIDVQLLLGLALYFTSGLGYKNIQANGMKEVMGDTFARFFAVEHIAMMLIAVVLVHIGRAKSKKATTDSLKHKNAFWFYLISLIIILASIPWPFKKGFEAVGWY